MRSGSNAGKPEIMKGRRNKPGSFWVTAFSCAVGLVFGTCVFCAANAAVHASDDADADRLLDGLSESEKQEFFDELYGDIEGDAVISEPYSIRDSADGESDKSTVDQLKDLLPDEEELERISEESASRVMDFAPFRPGYDTVRQLYRYTLLNDSGRIEMSVPMGGWSEHAVVLLPENGMIITQLHRDGESVSQEPGEDGAYLFRETGRYSFVACGSDRSAEYIVGSFRIVSVNAPVTDSFLWSPEGYRLIGAKADGRELPVKDGRWLSLSSDGLYSLKYEVRSAGGNEPQEYTLMFLRDTTAPVIEWDGEIVNGRFSGEVHYSVDEPDADVSIWFNGQPAVSETKTLAAAGNYFVIATDRYGNSRTWEFIVERRGEIPWNAVYIAAAIAAVIALLLIVTARAGMRIR